MISLNRMLKRTSSGTRTFYGLFRFSGSTRRKRKEVLAQAKRAALWLSSWENRDHSSILTPYLPATIPRLKSKSSMVSLHARQQMDSTAPPVAGVMLELKKRTPIGE